MVASLMGTDRDCIKAVDVFTFSGGGGEHTLKIFHFKIYSLFLRCLKLFVFQILKLECV